MDFRGSPFTWKGILVITGQTLSKVEREMIVEAATCCADNLYVTDPDDQLGATVVPTTDPNWDCNTSEGTRQQNHLVICLTEGMKQSKIKPTNHHKLAIVDQDPSENPTAFLQ